MKSETNKLADRLDLALETILLPEEEHLDRTPLPEWAVPAAMLYLDHPLDGMTEDCFARTYVTEYGILQRAASGLSEVEAAPRKGRRLR